MSQKNITDFDKLFNTNDSTARSSAMKPSVDDNLSHKINDENNLIYSSKNIRRDDDNPPPYIGNKKSTWPCDSFPNFNFENENTKFIKPEESKLIDKLNKDKDVCIISNEKLPQSYQKMVKNDALDRRDAGYYLENKSEPETFVNNIGPFCFVIIVIIFLMITSLAAKFIVTGTLKK